MIHDIILPVHVFAGMVALIVGYVALFAAKGGRLHKQTGRIFVYAMVVMGLGGSFLAAINPNGSPTNIVAGLVTFYLVTTAMRSVREIVSALMPWSAAFSLSITTTARG